MATSPIYLAEAKGLDAGADGGVPGLALAVTKCGRLSDAFEAFRASMHVRILIHAGEVLDTSGDENGILILKLFCVRRNLLRKAALAH